MGSGRIVEPVRFRLPAIPSDLGLAWEPVSLKSSDGVDLSAWFLPHPSPTGVLLLLHGYGSSKVDLLDLAAAFHHAGSFHLMLLDFRAHGDSGGRRTSFGLHEILDVEAVLAWLELRSSARNLPVGCFGVSMGGAVAIAAAGRFPSVRAVTTDSVYADLAKTIARSQWLTYHIPRVPVGQCSLWGTEFRLRTRLRDLDPVRNVSRMAPKPILIVHGQADIGVPVKEAQAVYQASQGAKELWIVPGAAHASCYYMAPEEYTRRVTGFFRDVLR